MPPNSPAQLPFDALVAALDDAQRVHQFGTEMVAAPAVIGQRRQ
jgi:hypothetical protein